MYPCLPLQFHQASRRLQVKSLCHSPRIWHQFGCDLSWWKCTLWLLSIWCGPRAADCRWQTACGFTTPISKAIFGNMRRRAVCTPARKNSNTSSGLSLTCRSWNGMERVRRHTTYDVALVLWHSYKVAPLWSIPVSGLLKKPGRQDFRKMISALAVMTTSRLRLQPTVYGSAVTTLSPLSFPVRLHCCFPIVIINWP